MTSILDHMDEYGTTMVVAEQQIGTTHAAVGAYLLGRWGLPMPIVETIAYHHCPNEKDDNDLLSLALVQADSFANRGRRLAGGDDSIIDRLDAAFLDHAGLLGYPDEWQSISINHLNAII